jgi:nucleotide-binding universal stress UspA family protein
MDTADRLALRRVLAATDFSPAAEVAVQHAAALAGRAGAELRLLHALGPRVPLTPPEPVPMVLLPDPEDPARAEGRLEELAAPLRARGLAVGVRVASGPAAHAICVEAESWAADLVVVGTRGHSGWRHLLLGSTAEGVVENAPCPVLTVHAADAPRERESRRVLVATDFSATACEAARRAAALLGLTENDTVVLAHALREPPSAPATVAPYNGRELHALVRTASLAELSREAASLRCCQGLAPRVELLDGHPPLALAEAARKLDADLVVAGARGVSSLAQLLLGSTAERLMQRAPCPVLVVPPAPFARRRGLPDDAERVAPAPDASGPGTAGGRAAGGERAAARLGAA